MSRRDPSGFRNLDWMTLSLYLSLVGIGWLMIYTVGYTEQGYSDFFNLKTNAGKQTMFIGISLLIMFFCFIIDWKFWRTFAYPIYGLGLLALIGVLIFGIKIKGATSWYSIGSFTLQPSEFAKFATCLAVSAFMSTYNTNIREFKSLATVVGLFFVPMFLILLQPDAGSALVFLSFFILLYRAGLSPSLYIYGFSAATILILGLVFNPFPIISALCLVSIGVLIFNIKKRRNGWLVGLLVLMIATVIGIYYGYVKEVLIGNVLLFIGVAIYLYQLRKSQLIQQMTIFLILGSSIAYSANYTFNNFFEKHQQDRINVWLRPSLCDPQGALYNVLLSKMTIGSGGLQGKGFLQGTMTKLNYVPEQSTDFIFCTIGEEQGFIGSLGIIGLYLLLLVRIITLAERQRSDFSRHYAYGVAGILFVHFFINIGMTMGLMPIIGIPLPFISYGGSSILGFTLLMSVLIKLDSHRFEG